MVRTQIQLTARQHEELQRVARGKRISLSEAANLVVIARIRDERFAELRFRAYGEIGGVAYCLAYTIREGAVRAISLRRAHMKEMARYGR